jgi:transcriptional regulator with GAF, ATPase, and Fis domain/tetratricopeptide (TPR) repeat protein
MNPAQRQIREGLIVGDHYRIEEPLRKDGRADVYACRDLFDEKTKVVIKILHSPATAPGAIGNTGREFSLLKKLRHPNLVRILDFGILEGSGGLFLIEEWVKGRDLYAGTEGIDIEAMLGLIVELSKTIQYLHTRGIVHGDLKPSNVILLGNENGAGKLKLFGYGLSPGSHSRPQAGAYGTLAYTAPEILLGGRAGPSSDIYSLGIIIYQILARRLPFDDEDPGFLIQKHLHGSVEMRPIEHLKGGVYLSQLVRRLLDKEPEKRPSSGEEIISLLSDTLGRDCSEKDIKKLENCISASRFVGREREMLFLKECASRVLESGRGRTVFISGEAGSGKSRCMEELRSWALLEGWRVIEGVCGMRDEAAYEPFRQIISRTEPADGQAVFHFSERPRMADSVIFESSSEFATGQFRDLLTRELVRRLTGRPTMLFLHDFHRADEATGTVLDYLTSDIQAHPVLMCVSYRTGEEKKGILGRVIDQAVRLERGESLILELLVEENVKQLVAGMTGDSGLNETLGSWIFESVGGNPFFLEEMLKHLIEQRVLYRKLGKWQFIEQDLRKLEVPAGIGAVLRRRLAQLPSTARTLANWLALFQRAVSRSLMSSVMSQSESAIGEAMRELSHRQMIRIERRKQEEFADFSHALIAEVIRGDLPKKLRQRMHRKIAEAIERECGADRNLQELAMHHIEGKSGAASVRNVLAAAFQSRVEFAHENALRCFEHAFKNRGSLTSRELCMAAIEASDTMFALGLPKRAIQLLKTEMNKNKRIGADLKARMFMQLALSYQHLGDLKMQEMCCKKGLRYFRNQPDTEANLTKAMLLTELAFGAVLQSRPRRGLVYLDRALKSCPDQKADALKGRMQIFSASLHRVACNFREALAASEKAAAILCRSGESYLTSSAYSTLGGILAGLGRFSASLESHKQAVLFSDESRSVILRSQALGNLAECLCRTGRIQEALNTAERASKSVYESNNPAIRYAFNTILAEIRLAAADYRGAHKLVHWLNQEAGSDLALFTIGHAHYLAANLNFIIGNFADALKHIEKLRALEIREAPFYESELAEALRARILSERGLVREALSHLDSLENAVKKKHWPYQMCIIKLHIAEILLKQQRLEEAEKYAGNALRLAKAMQSLSLISYGHLLLGLIYSPLRYSNVRIDSGHSLKMTGSAGLSTDRSIQELQLSYETAESVCPNDSTWRAHTELCLIFNLLSDADACLLHARKAYELLCKLEDQVPSEMLPVFYDAFGRSQAKLELLRMIESGREHERNRSLAVAQVADNERTRLLLRVSAAVNSIRELNPLLEAILDQLIPAVEVERALVFLRDESTGRLQLAKGRNNRRESLTSAETIGSGILEAVCMEGNPIVSANAQRDSRVHGKSDACCSVGKLFCAPLKASGRMMGVLYADHPISVRGLDESTINLFAAFCNLAAIAIDNSLAHQHVVKEKTELERYLHQVREEYPEIVGRSASVEALRDRISLAAAAPLDILVTGESGTGKELVVQAIYRTGRRKSAKCIPVDCGSLSDSLAEAELFGYRKGAFTGAAENRQGLLEAANGGIVFLDEISNMSFRMQGKLLRVLQEREIRRIGETVPRKIDIQVIAATNRDLLEEMRAERFREDLFYRLREMEIRVPPLRERLEDVPLLVEWFLVQAAERGNGIAKRFLPEALEFLCKYSYPGNIRELKNIISGCYFTTAGANIGLDKLPPEVRRGNVRETSPELNEAARLYREILDGRGGFEDLVKEPFQRHQLGSSVVRRVIEMSLKDTNGKYRDAFILLRISERRYATTMQFLKHYKCYMDFRPYRRNRSGR